MAKIKIGHEHMDHLRRTDPEMAERFLAWMRRNGLDPDRIRSLTLSPGGTLVEYMCRECEGCGGKLHADPLRPDCVHTYTRVEATPATQPPWVPERVAA